MARTERKADQIRDVEIFPLCNPYAEGSCTIRVGNTYLYRPQYSMDEPFWLVGSHLDSVIEGGRYDGVAGIIAGLRQFVRVCLPELSRRMDDNLASIGTNCAALGCALLISQRSYGLGTALVFALFGGVGATVAMASFASLREEVSFHHCPRCFQGLPITLVSAAITALSFMGFGGIVESIFGA